MGVGWGGGVEEVRGGARACFDRFNPTGWGLGWFRSDKFWPHLHRCDSVLFGMCLSGGCECASVRVCECEGVKV